MKRLLRLLALTTAVFLAAACSKEPAGQQSSDSIHPALSQVELPAVRTTRSIAVSASGKWSASSSQSWCTVNTTQTELQITVQQNSSPQKRTADITLRCGTARQTVRVTQQAAVSGGAIQPSDLMADASEQQVEIKLTTEGRWSISIPEQDDWYSIRPMQGEGNAVLLVTLSQNELTQARQSKAVIACSDKTGGATQELSFAITQKGVVPDISVSETQIQFSRAASEANIWVEASGLWSASVTEGQQWLSVKPVEGVSGRHAVRVSASRNDEPAQRSAMVRFTAQDNRFAILRIVQYPHDTMRVMTYNLHAGIGLDNNIDYPRVAEIISRINPDAVALQELDSVTTRTNKVYQLGQLASLTGMYGIFCPTINYQGGKYGIGILSRQKPERVFSVEIKTQSEARRAVVAEFEHYAMCCSHFPLLDNERYAAAQTVLEAISGITSKPVFFGGDLNASPSEGAISLLSKNLNMLSNPSEYTFPADTPTSTIDYLFLQNVEGRSFRKTDGGVLNEPVASDHRPVWVEVVL